MTLSATEVVCRSCGAVTAPGARFCASCGQSLVTRGDERRVVTVVFADLVGFTTLSEGRDPESVKNLVDRCFERLAVDIAEFGGRVDKIVGDAILALFGAPIAHEDDAERAVRAAFRMQESLEAWGASTGAGALRMRIGVNTGEVLVGALRAGGDWTAMGDVVNIASRLQTSAEPGQVVVGPETYAATRECVRYTPLGPVQTRGREATVDAYVAEEALTPPGRRRQRESPLVGREHELALLWGVVDTAVRHNRAGAVFVVADAGVGKTRLVQEVAARAACDLGARVLEGSCVPYGEANVWWPVAEALRASLGVATGIDGDEARDACRARVAENLGDVGDDEIDRVTHGLLHLLGLPGHLQNIDPARAREEVIRSLVAFIEGGARQAPIVIVLSDLHWADEVVLQLSDELLERAASLPIVLLATARAGLLERWQPSAGRHHLVVTHLDPLDRLAAAELLERLAPGPVPAELRELVLDRSGGNPFFLEELTALMAEGADGSELPHTLRGLVAARLDALPGGERHLLEDAAILGRRFPRFGIEVMAGKAHDHDIDDVGGTIASLIEKDLLVPDGHHLEFRSELVREVAYGTLTKAERIRGHAGVADWVERHQRSNPADIDRIAYHYATAAELVVDIGPVDGVADDLPARAVRWLEQALDQAEATELHVVGIRLASQGLSLADAAGASSEVQLRFLLSRAKARTALRELDAAEADLEHAEREADAAGDALLQARVKLGRGDLAQKRGDLEQSTELLESAITTFRDAGDERRTAESLLLLGMTRLFLGDNESGEASFTEAMETFRRVDDRRGEAWALQNLAWSAYGSGRIDEADQRCEDSARIFRELGDQGGLGWALGMLAYVRFHQGRWEEAESLCDATLAEAGGRGDPWATGMMLCLRALLRLWTGRSAAAIEPAQRATQLFRRIDDWWGLLMSLGALGRTLIAAGRVEEGMDIIDESVAIAAGVPYESAGEIAAMHVAAGSAQAGRPERAPNVTANGQASPAPHIAISDRFVAEALVLLQRGDAAGARQRLDRGLESGETGAYLLSSAALARLADGDCEAALAAAEAVGSTPGATYADRWVADLARAFVHARGADEAAADAALDEAQRTVTGTEDRMAQAVVGLGEWHVRRLLGRALPDDDAPTTTVAGPGWSVALALAAGR